MSDCVRSFPWLLDAPIYEITSPVFDEITIHLDPDYASGKLFVIKTINNSDQNVYIQRAVLNGKLLDRCYLNHGEIVAGGTLELEMGPVPNTHWGLAK